MTDLPPLKRIAAIHDLSGFGKCSLTIALPVISATGVECACIPTALLSTHTGEFDGYTFSDLSAEMLPIAGHWKREGITFDGIYSGYLASPEQGRLLETVIEMLADTETLIVVDPVMADNGEYYSGFDQRMRDVFVRLCGMAAVITPNMTEAALLTGSEYRRPPYDRAYVDTMLDRLLAIGPEIAAITGAQLTPDETGVAAKSRKTGESYFSSHPVRPGIFHGAGDLFASAFTALLVRGAGLEQALDIAVSLVGESIERSVRRGTPRRNGVDFEGALGAYIRRVENIFER